MADRERSEMERNNSADTKVSEEGGGGGARDARAESSLVTHAEDHGEAACSPAARGGPLWSRFPPAARGRDPMLEQVVA